MCGRHNRLTESDLKRSLDLYHQALAEDPTYAQAYAGIANSWVVMADDFLSPHEGLSQGEGVGHQGWSTTTPSPRR